MNLRGRTRLWLKTLTIIISLSSSTAITRAQEPARQNTPSVPATPPNSSGYGLQILTPTGNVNFSGYLSRLHQDIKKNWMASLPEAYFEGAQGVSVIRFMVNKDGTIQDISLDRSSGNDSLDQASLEAVRRSSPLNPLPPAFQGPYIEVRSSFLYNLSPAMADCMAPAPEGTVPPPFDRLELLAFLAGQGRARYEFQAVCQRGIDFTPDSHFLDKLRSSAVLPEVVEAVATFKPRQKGETSPDRTSAYELLENALAHASAKDLESADHDFSRAIALAPDSATLHLAYARKLLILKSYTEAESQSRESLKLWPEDASAHISLAMALMGLNRNSEATSEAREALRIFPNDQTGLVALGFSLAKNQQYKEAIPPLQEALPLAKQLPIIRKDLGICMVHAGDFD